MRQITALMLAGVLAAVTACECTPEQAVKDAALKEKTGVSTGCTPEKAAQGQVKGILKLDTPGK